MTKKTRGSLDTTGYTPDHALSMPQRAAHFYNWCAENFPYLHVPYNVGFRACMGQKALPKIDSPDVVRFQRKHGAVNRYLQRDYARHLVPMPGVGNRASVDDADQLVNVLPNKKARFRAAGKQLESTMKSIDPKKIPNTPELAEAKTRFVRDSKTILDILTPKLLDIALGPLAPSAAAVSGVATDGHIKAGKKNT